jgi:hypothetical protein
LTNAEIIQKLDVAGGTMLYTDSTPTALFSSRAQYWGQGFQMQTDGGNDV